MAFSFSSCLKDSKNYVNVSQSPALAELPLAAYTGVGVLTTEALPISTTPQVIQIAVNVAVAKPLSTPTTFTLALDPGAVATYNTANSTDYTLLPAADYSVSSWTVTVPAGQHLAYINVSVNSNLVDPAGQFILPVKIVSAGGLTIDQYNELLLNVIAKNQYDDVYSINGYVLRNSSTGPDPVLSGNFSGYTQDLTTVNATAVNWAPLWNGGSEAAGVAGTILTVNPTTNAVTITSSGNATLTNATGYNSHYDPANKVFYISYTWGTAPNNRAETDTLTAQ